MIYDPIKVIVSGELKFDDERGIVMRNWAFDMGGRPGTPGDYQCELLIAVRDRVIANFDARLMMFDDEVFDNARIHQALITTIASMPSACPQPPALKKPWWRRLFGA